MHQTDANGLSSLGCNAGTLSEIHTKAGQHCRAERLFCWRYGMICRKSSLILRQSYHQ